MAIVKYKPTAKVPRINLLVYGSPGVGKTYFACQAADHPDLQGVLLCNVDNGTRTIQSREEGLEIVDISKPEQLDEVFWLVANKQPGYEHIRTVVIDSLTDLHQRDLEIISGSSKNRKEDTLEIQDYSQDGLKMRRILRKFRDADFNLILTAHDKRVLPKIDSRSGQSPHTVMPTRVLPNMADKLCTAVMGFVDDVWCLDTYNGERVLTTQDDGIYMAKTREPYPGYGAKLGKKVVSPNLGAIYNLMLQRK